jgi:integrative and conjugative element protein (TIGR02256 family)
MTFIGGTRKLILKPEPLGTIQMLAQKGKRGTEAGGILLGKVYPHHVIIDMVTTPAKPDKAGFHFFIRSKPKAQDHINRAWAASNGHNIYLGEWHSHPVDHPIPSEQDRTMIHDAFRNTQMEIDFLYLVIAGLNNTFWVGEITNNGLSSLEQL